MLVVYNFYTKIHKYLKFTTVKSYLKMFCETNLHFEVTNGLETDDQQKVLRYTSIYIKYH